MNNSSATSNSGLLRFGMISNSTGPLPLRLASRGDARFHYVTGYVDEAKRRGLIPVDYQCVYGEALLLQINGNLCVMRCNRRNGKTFAGNLPQSLVMPQIVEGSLVPQEYEVSFIGSLRGATVEVLGTDKQDENHSVHEEIPAGQIDAVRDAVSSAQQVDSDICAALDLHVVVPASAESCAAPEPKPSGFPGGEDMASQSNAVSQEVTQVCDSV